MCRVLGIRGRAGAAVAGLAMAACGPASEVPPGLRIAGGNPEEGRRVIARVACGACHVIPGVAGARGIVGPSLDEFGRRNLIAGIIANRPDQLVRFVRDAPSLVPDGAMPNLPLSEREALDIAAYLYTLR
jgi:mono/diheme cytochrome c family protein